MSSHPIAVAFYCIGTLMALWSVVHTIRWGLARFRSPSPFPLPAIYLAFFVLPTAFRMTGRAPQSAWGDLVLFTVIWIALELVLRKVLKHLKNMPKQV